MLEYVMIPQAGHPPEESYRQMAEDALARARRVNPALGEAEWFGFPLVIGQPLGWRVAPRAGS